MGATGHGVVWSLLFLAPPPLREPRGAPTLASYPEPLHFAVFGRAPTGATGGAAHRALPNRPYYADVVKRENVRI
jgi:hypothetical protein